MPRPRKRASSTRRRVNTTWSRRLHNQLYRSPQALLSVAALFKHVGRFQRLHVCRIRTRVFAQAMENGSLEDFEAAISLIFLVLFFFSAQWRNVFSRMPDTI